MLPASSKTPAIIKLLIQGPLCKYLRAFPSVLTIPLDSQCCLVVFRVWISLFLGRIYYMPALSFKAKMKNRLNTELTFEPLWLNRTTWHQKTARSGQDCTALQSVELIYSWINSTSNIQTVNLCILIGEMGHFEGKALKWAEHVSFPVWNS